MIVAAICPICGEPVWLDRSTYQNDNDCPLGLPRELALFSWSIPPSFVVSPNVPMCNTRSVWLCFGAFLSPPARSLRIHWPLSSRFTLHATRPTPPSAGSSGVRSCADPPPLATACHRPPNCQNPNGPDLDERSLYFSMSPNQAIFTDKIICSSPPAAAHPLTVLSWPRRSTPVCSGMPAGWQ